MEPITGFNDAELKALLPKMRCNALKLTGNLDQANDLIQSTCEKMLRHRHRFIAGDLFAWSCTVMRNTLRDKYRRDDHFVYLNDEHMKICANDDQQGALEAKQQLTRFVSSKVSDEMMETLMLASDGMKYEMVGELINVSVGTVKSRVFRAREILRACG